MRVHAMKSTSTAADAPQFSLFPAHGDRRRKAFPWGKLTAILLIVLCLPFILNLKEGQRAILALCVACFIFFLLKRAPGAGIAAAIGFLSLVGGLRRWLIPAFGWSPTDSFLVAVPIAAVLFLLMTRRNYKYTPVMRLLLVLLAMMALEVVNPLQGGLTVGVAGILFFIAPLLWYFIGRQIGSASVMQKLLRCIVVLSICAALYGLYQTYVGFNAGEWAWIAITYSHYVALNVGGAIRAFSFFTSAAEYAQFVGVGVVVLWVMFLRGARLAIVPIPLLLVALFLASIRYAFVTTAFACTVVWAIQGRSYQSWIPRGLIALLIVVAALFFGLNKITNSDFGTAQTQAFADHQAQGLLHSGNAKYSTAGFHLDEVVNGIIGGFTTPTGRGLGSTTIASDKFGGNSESSEFDISNIFLSLGFVGGILYIIVLVNVLLVALQYWQQSRSLAGLAIVGILVQLLGVWFNGGFYAASTLAWLCVGILECLYQRHAAKQTQRESPKFLASASAI